VIASVKIADSVQQGLNSLLGFIPNIIGFLIILLIGYVIARVVKGIVSTLLEKVGLDRALHSSDAGTYVEKVSPGASPARLIGSVAFWFIFLFAISAAIGALKIPSLSTFIAQVQAFLPNIVVALLIFVIAAVLAGGIGGAVHKLMGDTPTGKMVRAIVPALIMAIALFMVLDQLRIAHQIVTITYAGLIGMLALAGALAFGLGGRDVAAQMLNQAYSAGQRNADQVKQDVQTGKARAEDQAQTAKAKADSSPGRGSSAARPQGA
jgi:hypothetical protein